MIKINNNIKKELFYQILRIRRIEEGISKKYNDQKMRCPVHLSIGQEAIAVGVSALLKKKRSSCKQSSITRTLFIKRREFE